VAKDVTEKVRELNRPEPTGPAPYGELIAVHQPESFRPRILDDPLADSSHLAAEEERLRVTLAEVSKHVW
jgi:hypothetical protein